MKKRGWSTDSIRFCGPATVRRYCAMHDEDDAWFDQESSSFARPYKRSIGH